MASSTPPLETSLRDLNAKLIARLRASEAALASAQAAQQVAETCLHTERDLRAKLEGELETTKAQMGADGPPGEVKRVVGASPISYSSVATSETVESGVLDGGSGVGTHGGKEERSAFSEASVSLRDEDEGGWLGRMLNVLRAVWERCLDIVRGILNVVRGGRGREATPLLG